MIPDAIGLDPARRASISQTGPPGVVAFLKLYRGLLFEAGELPDGGAPIRERSSGLDPGARAIAPFS